MTVVVSLNFGDRIYLVSDTLTTRFIHGKYVPTGRYCLKLYRLHNYNSIVGFAGSIQKAVKALARIECFASSQVGHLDEVTLFDELPKLFYRTSQNEIESKEPLYIMYAGLLPNSQAYEKELYPGLGVPPKTVCGYLTIRDNPRKVSREKSSPFLIPTNPMIKITPINPTKMIVLDKSKMLINKRQIQISNIKTRMLMDGYVIGSGSRKVEITQKLYKLKYDPPYFVMTVLPIELHTYFEEFPIDRTGVGGAYYVMTISENGFDSQIIDPRYPKGGNIEYKDDAFFVVNMESGEKEIIQSIWDERLSFDFIENEII